MEEVRELRSLHDTKWLWMSMVRKFRKDMNVEVLVEGKWEEGVVERVTKDAVIVSYEVLDDLGIYVEWVEEIPFGDVEDYVRLL